MYVSGDAIAPPHVGLEHCPGIDVDPSPTFETDVMAKELDYGVSVLSNLALSLADLDLA